MRERAARIGADVALVSTPGCGTQVVLTLPAHPVANGHAGADATPGKSDFKTQPVAELRLDDNHSRQMPAAVPVSPV